MHHLQAMISHLQADWLDADDAAEHTHKLDDCKRICQGTPLILHSQPVPCNRSPAATSGIRGDGGTRYADGRPQNRLLLCLHAQQPTSGAAAACSFCGPSTRRRSVAAASAALCAAAAAAPSSP